MPTDVTDVRVLLDTNVLLDVLLDRQPWAEDASAILTLADRGEVTGLACAISFTTVFYVMRKEIGAAEARSGVSQLLGVLDVAPVGRAVLDRAVQADVADFEDAVVMECARVAGVDHIVTRDAKGFVTSPVPAHTPAAFRQLLDLLH